MTTRRAAAVVGVAAVMLASPGPHSGAQTGARQSATFTFDEVRPGQATSLEFTADYTNPDDPASKPYAVQTVVETLAPGAVIDTTVPEVCTASDAELIAAGADACPVDSRVGAGEVELDTGVPGPFRVVTNAVTEFNGDRELILLFEPTSGAGVVRAVSRAPITDGNRITAQSPPLPGGPPDGFTAIKRVRLRLDEIMRDGRAYVTTPPACPADGQWVNTVEFTYRDGVTESVSATTPCVAAEPPVVRELPKTR